MPNNDTRPQPFTDMPHNSWIDRWLPANVVPYAKAMRLDRPIGIWLLLIPGLWSIAMAARPQDMWHLIGFFTMGSIFMRGAGCVYNDLVDKDIDRQVERTKNRPIASGALSVKNAIILIVVLLFLSLMILLSLPRVAIFLGFFVLIPVTFYPVLKRITYWPQLMLGIAYNWGALMGWSASHVHLSTTAFLFYGAGILWTMIYDTIYAHQDKEDDLLINVKSTALKFGDYTPYVLLGCAVGMFLMLYIIGFREEMTYWYFLAIWACCSGIAYQVANLDYDNPSECLKAFRRQAYAGWIILAGIFLGRFA